jgi:choline-sulfatase
MSQLRALVCVVWLAASALGANAPPNIVLITLDTTRADRMGFLGSTSGLTPNLDVLAKQSVVFTRAYSQVPITTPSHATILTGTYPVFHQVNNFGMPLREDLPYAPAILKAHGYQTAAFVGSLILDPNEKFAPGFDRGFDTYDAGFFQGQPGSDRYKSSERRAGVVVAHALAWLAKHPRGPYFVWIHLYDPHDPYNPPEPYKNRYKTALYDGEVAYTDSAVGKLLTQLRLRGLYKNSVIAVMADHGEGLGAHGEEFHGYFLYDETIRVPLIVKLPSEQAAGTRIGTRVGLVDVLPTILQAAGITPPAEVQGESLLGMMTAASEKSAEGPRDRLAYSETDYPRNAFHWSPIRSLRTGKYLFIEAPRPELYDESTDPKAEHNDAASSKAVADTLAGQLDNFRKKTASSREAPKVTLDPAQQAKLASLGYMSAGTSNSGRQSKDAGADPKDKIQIGNMIHRANALMQDAQCAESIPLLEKVIADEPSTLLYLKLGECFTQLGNFAKAVPVLRKALEMNPNADTHIRLGIALSSSGDVDAGIAEFQKVVAMEPGQAQGHILLAHAYARAQRVPETIKECESALELAPDDYGMNLTLGRFLEVAGKFEASLPNLKKAAVLEPKDPAPHIFLADAYDRLGRDADSARERSLAKRLQVAAPQR